VARLGKDSEKAHIFETSSKISELKLYLNSLKGTKILTIEESTASQWLYVELRNEVDELIICDPRRNHLLSEGAKNDRNDAEKLVRLLKAKMLRPVFHTADEMIYLRKLVSGYGDLVKAGVRLKCQRSALFRANGLDKDGQVDLINPSEIFVLQGLNRGISLYEEEKARYEEEFSKMRRKHKMIQNLCTVMGIGEIGAVKIAAIVVDPRRFPTKGHFLSYCGLVKLSKISGGKSYGKKNPQYNRTMKSVFKTAAFAALSSDSFNHFFSYYENGIKKKGLSNFNARHALARRIATICWGVLKTGKKVDLERLKCNSTIGKMDLKDFNL